MAPKNKRDAASDLEKEPCKRMKDEVKTPTKSSKSETKEAEAGKLNNNIIDNDSHNSNGSKANEVEPTTDGDTAQALNDSTKRDVDSQERLEKPVAQVNGATKNEKESQDTNDKKPAVINGNEPKEQVAANSKSSPDNSSDANKVSAPAESSEEEDEEDELTGTLLICGGANWEMTGRKELPKAAKKPTEANPAARNLWGPHRVRLDGSDRNLRVRGVFSGCNACHSVIVTEDGTTMTFGRNDKGQLGLGDTEIRTTPVVVSALKGINIVAAACGRSHTLFLSSEGMVFSCGDNKMGQCGTNQQSVHQITTPVRIAFKENKPIVKMACGGEFSMIVDTDGKLYSFGHPEHGQLGHNSEGKYFTSGNKYAFHCEYAPRRIVTFIEKSREGHVSPVDDVSIVDVACGTNHTLAVDKRHRCFSWGFAGYHRLGHSETKNELVPRSIKVFDAPLNSGRGASRVFAGATYSMALDVNGLLYFWGQNKSSGEATMYPKNVQDLCGWRVTAVSCANRSIFVIADGSCISWGPSPTYGELGYGEGKSKSSTTPQEVKTLDGIDIKSVACGFGHTLLIARDKSPEDQANLNKLHSWP